jgi:integrase/recombinase XerD
VTHLRKLMLEELQRRNYSQHTTRYYIRTVEDFARRFHCPPDRLGPRHIREYQAELFQKRKLSSGTVTIRLAALRFFYTKTLRRAWSVADTPWLDVAYRREWCERAGLGFELGELGYKLGAPIRPSLVA